MWRTILALSILGALSACSSMGDVDEQFNGVSVNTGPTSAADPRLLSPQYYMDDDGEAGWWTHDSRPSNR